jgi:hypothetical protein
MVVPQVNFFMPAWFIGVHVSVHYNWVRLRFGGHECLQVWAGRAVVTCQSRYLLASIIRTPCRARNATMLHLGTVLVLLQPTPLHPSSIVAFSSVPELADPRIVASTSSIFLFLFKTACLMHLSLARHFGEAVKRIEVHQ